MRTFRAALIALPATGILAIAVLAGGPGDPRTSDASPAATEEIPPSLLPAYRAAANRCANLPWQVLAGIGQHTTRHAAGHLDPATGDTAPPIVGPPEDGSRGRPAIADTAEPDGYARTYGPMHLLRDQFGAHAVLAPGRPEGATPSIDNAWDAIHTTAEILCANQPADLAAAVGNHHPGINHLEAVLGHAVRYGMFSAPPTDRPPTAAVDGSTVSGDPTEAVAAAVAELDVPLVWGGYRPYTGFDPAGLTQWAYAQAGVGLPRTIGGQHGAGVPVEPSTGIQPGDLLILLPAPPLDDLPSVAIAETPTQMIVAARYGTVTRKPIDRFHVAAVRRIATQ